MRTNISNNIVPNNYFIIGKKPIYIDFTRDIFLKKYGSNCNNLELVSNKYTNNTLYDIELVDSIHQYQQILFDTKCTLQRRITPTNYFKTGFWKTKNNNYTSDNINDIYVEYPVKINSPNAIIINKNIYVLNFSILTNIFEDNDTFEVYFIPCDNKLTRMFLINSVTYIINKLNYSTQFDTSIFYDKRYTFNDNNYFIALKSITTNKIFISDPSKYIHVTQDQNLESIQFNIHNKKLNYNCSTNSDVLITYNLSGLPINTTYQLKINNLYTSPLLKYTGNGVYTQPININTLDRNIHNVELITENKTIMDLSSELIIDLNYNTNVYILQQNILDEDNIELIIGFDEKYIGYIVNISIGNYFIKNDLITKNNYINYLLNIKIDNTFSDGKYFIYTQICGSNKFYGKSTKFINIINTKFSNTEITEQIIPTFGYNYIPFSYNPIYNPIQIINKEKYIIIPDAVKSINVNMIYNNIQIIGNILVTSGDILYINNDIVKINNNEVINITTKTYSIHEYTSTNSILGNQVNIEYICEDTYILRLNNYNNNNKLLHVFFSKDTTQFDLTFYNTLSVEYNDRYGYHLKLNKNNFDYIGELHVYYKYIFNDQNAIYLGNIIIRDHDIKLSLNLISNIKNIIYVNDTIRGKINIITNNIPIIDYYDIYFVDDLIGTNPYFLTKSKLFNKNTIDFSFVYTLNTNSTKYIRIYGKYNSFIIDKIINIPLKITKNNQNINKLSIQKPISKLNNLQINPSLYFIAVGNTNSKDTFVISSDSNITNPLTWSRSINIIRSTTINNIAYDNQTWIVTTPSGLFYSDINTSWSPTNVSSYFLNGTSNGVKWGNNMWIATGQSTTNHTILYSNDGIVWNPVANNLFLNSGYTINYNGIIWVAGGGNKTGVNGNTLIWSYDGFNWFASSNGNDFINNYGGICNKVIGNSSIWVAGGSGSIISSLIWSNNGSTWNDSVGGGLSILSNCYDIEYNGTIFMAVGDGPNIIVYSSDGKNWLASNDYYVDSLTGVQYMTKATSVTWNNKWYVTTGDLQAGVIISSTDGINWISESTFNGSIFTKIISTPVLPSLKPIQTKTIIGVYTTFDLPPNRINPSYFLEQYGLYKYKNMGDVDKQYSNYSGYLILQPDPLSNSISQNLKTINTFISNIISQLGNKEINLINVPALFNGDYIIDNNNFVAEVHTFEYYNNVIFNNKLINVQNSLCLNVVQNNQLITDISTIQNNFLQALNNEIRNYVGQNTVNSQLEQLNTLTSTNPRFSWIEDLGHYIAQYSELIINNTPIEKITSDWMNIWNQVNLPVGHKSGYAKMIGNVDTLTKFDSRVLPKYQLKIPLPFYFNRYNNAGLSIPLISLMHSDLKLTLQLEKLQNLIISDPLTKFSTSGRPKLRLYLKYIYLENEERKIFAQSKHEYLIEQENYRNYSYTGTQFKTKINLKQPVKDIFWFAQPKQNATNKQYFNYTNSKYYKLLSNYDRYDEDNPVTELSRKFYQTLYEKYTNLQYIPMYINNQIKELPETTKSPINNSMLIVNGQKRFNEDSGITTLVNFHRYNNIPVNGLHAYSFARYPNEYQPSGSCNFSQLNDALFVLDTDDGAYNIQIIARNYNLLRIMGGQAGLGFEI